MVTIPAASAKQTQVLFGIGFIILLLFTISLTAAQSVLQLFGLTAVNNHVFLTSRLLYWVSLLLLWLYAIKIEKQPLLLWDERKYSVGFYLLSIGGIFLSLIVGMVILQSFLSVARLSKKSTVLSALIVIFKGSHFLLVFTCLTAGVVEELIFRGYLQPRLQIIFKQPYVAIGLNAILFGALHYKYGTVVNVLGPTVIGAVFSYYYWRYKNIKVIILCHFLWDLLSLLLLVNIPVKPVIF